MTRSRPDQDALVFSRVLEERTNVCIMKMGEADKNVTKAKSAIDGLRKDKSQLNQGTAVCGGCLFWLRSGQHISLPQNSFHKKDTTEAVANIADEIERLEKAIAKLQQDTERLNDKERVWC